jgi:hypothetical protein
LHWVWPDGGLWELASGDILVVQNESGVECDDLIGGSDQRVDVRLLDCGIINDKAAEPH